VIRSFRFLRHLRAEAALLEFAGVFVGLDGFDLVDSAMSQQILGDKFLGGLCRRTSISRTSMKLRGSPLPLKKRTK
jgi:hypothetical protein